jgi:hypothetical protein
MRPHTTTAGARSRTVAALLLASACVLGACSTLTPDQQRSEGQVRGFADRTARVYGLPRIHVLISHNPQDPPGSYRRGFFSVSAITLVSTFRDAIVAHELAHYVLGHEAPLPGDTSDEMKRAYQQRELDANAKAVEILARVGGMSEERALKTMYAYLLGVHWALERYPRLNLSGHKPPCEEIADLLSRFPEQQPWTASLECAPEGLRDAVAG